MEPTLQPVPAPTSIKEGDFVKSLARGLLVLRTFDDGHRSQTLSDVARRAGLSRATARRLLLTLKELGYVAQEGRSFTLTPSVLRLGHAYLSSSGVPDIAQPFLETLSADIHEASSMAVLDGSNIVYVARAATTRLFSLTLSIGARLPAYCTAMGRVLMSEMPEAEVRQLLNDSELIRRTDHTVTRPKQILDELAKARDQGWYVIDQELEIGVRAASAPVRDRRGHIVAAINSSTSSARMSVDEIVDSVVPRVVRAADEVSTALRAQ